MTTLVRPRRVTRRVQVEQGCREEPGIKPIYARPDPAVDIDLTDNWQTVVNAQPVGTTFWVRSGRHVRPSLNPRTGDRFFGEHGAKLDGENVAVYAFNGIPNLADRVEIRNLEITNYDPPLFMGAIRGGDHAYAANRSGWVVEDCELHHNDEAGIRTSHFMTIRRVWSHHNSRCGFQGIATGLIMEDNDVSYSDYLGLAPSDRGGVKFVLAGWGGESGGTRTGTAPGSHIRHNRSHHNKGHGLWLDIDCIDCVIERNHIYDNDDNGVFWEISYRGIVTRNLIERCGLAGPSWVKGAGVLVASSEDVEVSWNDVLECQNGIIGSQQTRDEHTHQHLLKNFKRHHNTVRQLDMPRDGSGNSSWAAGLAQDCAPCYGFYDPFAAANGNTSEDNIYQVAASLTTPYAWLNARRAWTAWRDTYGWDDSGTFTTF